MTMRVVGENEQNEEEVVVSLIISEDEMNRFLYIKNITNEESFINIDNIDGIMKNKENDGAVIFTGGAHFDIEGCWEQISAIIHGL